MGKLWVPSETQPEWRPADSLGERVRQLRHQRDWTLDQLTAEAGVSKGYLSAIENGRNEPTGRVLLRLARALGASVDYLLRGTGEDHVHAQEVPPPIDVAARANPPPLTATAAEAEVLTLVLRELRHAMSTGEQLSIHIDPWASRAGVYVGVALCPAGYQTEVTGEFKRRRRARKGRRA